MGSRALHPAPAASTTAPPTAAITEGRLFYVACASDAGNDRLIAYARGRLDDGHRLMFAHRYTTRPAGGECEVALSGAEFSLRRRLGLFAMDWEASDHCYGVGMELNYWLATGLSVVVNGSHAHFERALSGYPQMTLIWVSGDLPSDAPRPETAPRLAARPAGTSLAPGYRMVHINSNGSLRLAGDRLVAVLTGCDP